MVTDQMAEASAAVIDALNGLLEAAVSSIFVTVEQHSPYVGRASAELRHQLGQMATTARRQSAELSALITQLGGYPLPRRTPRSDEQYLAYLSLKFLIPKLIEEKQLIIQRFENLLGAFPDAPEDVRTVLQSQLGEHHAELESLRGARSAPG